MPGRGRGGLASFLKDWVCKHNIVGCLILQNGSGRNANKRNVVGYMGVENCNEKGGFNNALHLPIEESTTSHNIILILCVLHSSKKNKNISWPLLTLSASNECLLLMAYLSTHTEFLILRTFLKAVLQQFSLSIFKWLFMSGRSNDCRVMSSFTPRLQTLRQQLKNRPSYEILPSTQVMLNDYNGMSTLYRSNYRRDHFRCPISGQYLTLLKWLKCTQLNR